MYLVRYLVGSTYIQLLNVTSYQVLDTKSCSSHEFTRDHSQDIILKYDSNCSNHWRYVILLEQL